MVLGFCLSSPLEQKPFAFHKEGNDYQQEREREREVEKRDYLVSVKLLEVSEKQIRREEKTSDM